MESKKMKLTKSYKSKEKSYKKELQKQRKASGNGKLYNLKLGIRQYILLLFHFKKLLKSYVNLFYRFCVTLLFWDIWTEHKSASFPPSWILADMHVTS
jgi:hypothetical protein